MKQHGGTNTEVFYYCSRELVNYCFTTSLRVFKVLVYLPWSLQICVIYVKSCFPDMCYVYMHLWRIDVYTWSTRHFIEFETEVIVANSLTTTKSSNTHTTR